MVTFNFRQKDAFRLLEIYASSDLYKESGRIDGPTQVWRFLMFMPILSFWLTIFVARYTPHPGAVTLVGVLLIFWFVNGQTHRMNHVCRWPNPVHAGLFAGGILSTIIVFLVVMFKGTATITIYRST